MQKLGPMVRDGYGFKTVVEPGPNSPINLQRNIHTCTRDDTESVLRSIVKDSWMINSIIDEFSNNDYRTKRQKSLCFC